MTIHLIRPKEYRTSLWSGGKTTELFIYPQGSNYKSLDFDFRLSSASVEIENSTFTTLPKVLRKLMILDGEIEITHKNRYTKILKKFDVDEFEGDWNTSSVGKCIDFNVMTRRGLKSELYQKFILKGKTHTIEFCDDFLVIYLLEGKLNITFDNRVVPVKEKEVLVCESKDKVSFLIEAQEESSLVLVKITR